MSRQSNRDENSSAFLTQKGEKMSEVKKEIADLEQLLAGATQMSQSTSLLKKRKEMREVDESLEVMKKEYKKKMDECEDRRIQFEAKQAKMKDQVQKFEKFIQENDAKRARAELKAKQERRMFEEKGKELCILEGKIKELEQGQSELEQDLVRKGRYKYYLERVVEESDQYEEMSDILNRYKTLKDSNVDLMTQVQEQDRAVDALRYQLQGLRIEKQNQLLVSNSLFGQNQKDLERIRLTVKKEEEEKDLQEDKKKNVTRESSQIVQAVKNIFNRCQATMRNKQKMGANRDVLEFNLDVIHCRLIDLIEICDEYQKETEAMVNNGGTGGYTGNDTLSIGASTTVPGLTTGASTAVAESFGSPGARK